MGNVSEVIIQSQTGPDTPEPEAHVGERPANVPEKFWNAEKGEVNTEALLASYGELEKKIGSPKPEDAEADTETTDEEVPTEDEDPEGDEARNVAEAAGLDVPALEAHWEEHGSLPEDTYEKLAAVGVDKALVDEFVAYRVAQGETLRNEMLGSFGGEEVVNKMVEWASKNYSQEKAEAFNDGVNSKNKGKIELALKALKADYDKSNGVKPKLLKSSTGGAPKGDRYASLEEMLADQRNPKYRTDPAFRQRVIEKLSRSDI